MARQLQLPHDLNPDHQRALAPQWMTEHHDNSNINSVLVEKGSVKRPTEDTSGQRHDKSTWRSEDKPSDKMWNADKTNAKPWGADKQNEPIWGTADQFHHPQPDRFAPQRPRVQRPHQDFAIPAKGNDRWRDDGQIRRPHPDQSNVPWGSPVKGGPVDSLAPNDSWSRTGQVHGSYQRPSPGQVSHRADTGRWGPGQGKWDSEDHHTNNRPTPWDAPKVGGFDQGTKDASRNGVARGFQQYGRSKLPGRELPQLGTGASNRWTPPSLAHQQNTQGEDKVLPPVDVLPAKLGHGPQKYKYTVEQLLSIYADLSEKNLLDSNHHLELIQGIEYLPAAETEANLIQILNQLAQQMVEEGYATKAERRLASRLNALAEASANSTAGQAVHESSHDNDTLAPDVARGSGFSEKSVQDPRAQESFLDGLVGHQSPFSTPKFQDNSAYGSLAPDRSQPIKHDNEAQQGIHHGGIGQVKADAAGSIQTPEMLKEANEWFYKDPKGEIQGPYSQEAIETWHDSGFFPPDLPMSTSREAPHWYPLNQLLSIWRTPAQDLPNSLNNANSFLPHQASGHVPHQMAQSAASRMLDNAEAGIFSQPSSRLTAQAFNAQASQPNQARLESGLFGQHAPQTSFPSDRQGLGLQMSQASSQMNNQLNYQLQQSNAIPTPGFPHHFLGQQMSHQMSSLGSPQPAQFAPRSSQHPSGLSDNQNGLGLSALDTQFRALGLQGRQFDMAQPQQNLAGARAPGVPGDLLSRLQGHQRQPAAVQPAALQSDPIVELLGSITRDSHGSSQNLAPIGPQSSQAQHQRPRIPEHSGAFDMNDWMGAQPSTLSELPSQDLQSTHSGFSGGLARDSVSTSLTEPSVTLSSVRPAQLDTSLANSLLRPEIDQVIQPKPKPAIAAVGPPARKIAPARLAESSASAQDPVLEEPHGAPFQKVEKPKRREQVKEAQVAPPPPPPAAKTSQPKQVAPQAVQQEVQRGPTFGEAAGLMTHPSGSSEPSPAPWAGQQPKGPRQKTLLEIQREEAEQARVAAEQEAVQAAQRATISQNSSISSSWAKPLAKSTKAPVTSFAEIQEQESRQKIAQPPPPPPSAQPQWASNSGHDGKTLANRLSQSLNAEQESSRRHPKPQRQSSKISAQPSQDDDELFWDPRPATVPKSGSIDAQRNGSSISQKPARVSEEHSVVHETSEAEGSLSPEFAEWCRSKLRELRNGDDDLNLILFLMTVGSNAEIAEYMTQFFGRTSAVAAFSNEFIKRKLVEQSGRKKGRSKKSSSQSMSSASSTSGIGVAPLSSGATGWSKLPKKKKKGQKMDTTMLGFGTGTNYAALEKLEG